MPWHANKTLTCITVRSSKTWAGGAVTSSVDMVTGSVVLTLASLAATPSKLTGRANFERADGRGQNNNLSKKNFLAISLFLIIKSILALRLAKCTLLFAFMRFDHILEIYLQLKKLVLCVSIFWHELRKLRTAATHHHVFISFALKRFTVRSPFVLSCECRRLSLWDIKQPITFRFHEGKSAFLNSFGVWSTSVQFYIFFIGDIFMLKPNLV